MAHNPGTVLTETTARHLLRRTGFGAPLEEVSNFVGLTRAEAAAELLNFNPSSFRPNAPRDDRDLAHNKWVKYMVKSRVPLQEKLTLFWHDHFATNVTTVFDVTFMANQNRTLRRNCKGNMRDLVKAINKDAAMMRFLDTDDNRKNIPNENYARELQELFTLGVYDFGTPPVENYSQDDIVQIARAFTGWRYEDNGTPFLNTNQHDTQDPINYPGPDRGEKIIYAGNTGVAARPGGGGGNFTIDNQGNTAEGEPEIDNVVDIIFAHTDSDGQNTVARRTTKRLLEYFARPFADPIAPADLAAIDEIVAVSGFDTTFDIQALLQTMFECDIFYPTFPQSTHDSVKWPIDFVVSTVRLLGMKLKGRDQFINTDVGNFPRVLDHLRNMGQEAMDPPSVFGWNWETAWISSAAMLSRFTLARDLTTARAGAGRSVFRPLTFVDDLVAANGTANAGALVDRVTDVLGVREQLSTAERDHLLTYLGPATVLVRNADGTPTAKLSGLFALVIQSPAYQVH